MLFFILCVLLIVGYLVFSRSKDEEFDKIPGPKGIPFLGNALEVILSPVQISYYFRRQANKYKDIFKLKIGPNKFVLITNPEDVEVLISGIQNNNKGFVYKFIKLWLKEGLLISEGAKWHDRRKILTPTFHFNILRHFFTLLDDNSQKLAESLEQEVGKPRTDIASYIVPFTLNSICETAMGIKLDEEEMGKNYKNGILDMGNILVYRGMFFWLHSDFIFSLSSLGRQFMKILNLITSFRDTVVEKRMHSEEHKNLIRKMENNIDSDDDSKAGKRLAMLDLLLREEKRGTIDRNGIGEEVDTFMFEGHDTTSTALQFTFMLLANHLECQDKIVEEYHRVMGSNSVTMNDLTQMKYLECCIKESLRLYPPVHFISRRIDKTIKFKNFEVSKGTDCTILIYDLHRSNYFKAPLRFRPERFIDEAPTWHPYAYIPFSAGPRNCIGQKFAMMELKLAVLKVLCKYKLLPITRPQDIMLTTDIVLRTETPIYLKVERRE